jgi:succinate dehydrogenase / fumarate reductase, cytochrome b subunit
MSLALNRENYFWHKLHSLTGIVPVGYYMVQHLVLNTFSLAGAAYFNGVIAFFDAMPWYFLLTMELLLIWIPLAFHAVYGVFICSRGKFNYSILDSKYGWSQNRMYTLQRYTGVFLFFFLILHVATTTGAKYLNHDSELIKFNAWHDKLTGHYGLWLILYLVGVAAASYHLSFGVWNFCIRWGITISDAAQVKVQKFSVVCFIALTVIGWGALAGFLIRPKDDAQVAYRSGGAVVVAVSRAM